MEHQFGSNLNMHDIFDLPFEAAKSASNEASKAELIEDEELLVPSLIEPFATNWSSIVANA